MVTVRSRVFASDEELAKRNDDYKAGDNMPHWKIRNRPVWTAKRLFILLVGAFCIWLFVHNIPTDLGPKDSRRPRYVRNIPPPKRTIQKAPFVKPDFKYAQEKERDVPAEPTLPTKQPQHQTEVATGFHYDGPVKFFSLATSLHAISNIVDYRQGNRHVLFAASDLKSLSSLMPIACEMANWKRNHVHMAIMGRDEMSIEEIQQVNGANFQDCPIYFHDARPDKASISTDGRMQLSVSGALGHINTYMLPRAVITTDADHENVFFTVGVSRTSKAMGLTHISIPKDAPQKLRWMARLDANALNSWFSATFDILVQAPLDSAGSLIRLLTSLERADYTGFSPPRLIIELPHEIGLPTQNFLTRFKWPPFGTQGSGQSDQLLIRRRISEQHIPVEEASRRFVESFFPSSPKGPHLLVLSPQAELSPAYFHYLKLHLLEFRHSYDRSDLARNMLGISLETPSTHLNASAEFAIPRVWERSEHDEDDEPPVFEPFCWQAPNSNAGLYFSDKWIELHSFLTKRRTASLHPLTEMHHSKRLSRVSHHSPSWMEHVLDLMRLRGYYLHYPGAFQRMTSSSFRSSSSFSTAEESLVIVHNELYQPPEEFAYPVTSHAKKRSEAAPALTSNSVLEVAPDYLSSHHPAEGTSNTLNDERPLVRSLDPILPPLGLIITDDPLKPTEPANEPLPPLEEMALLDFAGQEFTPKELTQIAAELRRGYRHFAGGCTVEEAKDDTHRELGSAADLFCLDDKNVDNSMLFPHLETQIAPEQKRAQAAGAKSAAVPTNNANTKPTRIHGADGVAASINRVKNAPKYEETAKAGFAKKMADKEKNYQWLTPLDPQKLQLTEEEKAQLTQQVKDDAATLAGANNPVPPDDGEFTTADTAGQYQPDPFASEEFPGPPPPPAPAPAAQKPAPPMIARSPVAAGAKPVAAAAAAAHAAAMQLLAGPQAKPHRTAVIRDPLSDLEADDDSVPRDAPLVDHDVRPGRNFEQQMAQRDAAKKESLNDRARLNKGRNPVVEPGTGTGAEETGVIEDEETVPAGAQQHAPIARGDTAAKGRIPARAPVADVELSAEDEDVLSAADPMKVLLDDDFNEQPRDTVGDMHPADVAEEERRFGAGGARAQRHQ